MPHHQNHGQHVARDERALHERADGAQVRLDHVLEAHWARAGSRGPEVRKALQDARPAIQMPAGRQARGVGRRQADWADLRIACHEHLLNRRPVNLGVRVGEPRRILDVILDDKEVATAA